MGSGLSKKGARLFEQLNAPTTPGHRSRGSKFESQTPPSPPQVAPAKRILPQRRSHGELPSLPNLSDAEDRTKYVEASHMMEGDILRLFCFFETKNWSLETVAGISVMMQSVLGSESRIDRFMSEGVLRIYQVEGQKCPSKLMSPMHSNEELRGESFFEWKARLDPGPIKPAAIGGPSDVPPTQNREIDPTQIATAIWNFCTMDRRNLVMFIYNTYAANPLADISTEEIREMMIDLYDTEEQANEAARTFQAEVEGLSDGKGIYAQGSMSLHTFFNVVGNRPSLMEPLFSLQQKLRIGIIGESFWRQRESIRREILGKSMLDSKELEDTCNLKESEGSKIKYSKTGMPGKGKNLSGPALELSSDYSSRRSSGSSALSIGRHSLEISGRSSRSSSRDIIERLGSPAVPKMPRSTICTAFSAPASKSRCNTQNSERRLSISDSGAVSDESKMDSKGNDPCHESFSLTRRETTVVLNAASNDDLTFVNVHKDPPKAEPQKNRSNSIFRPSRFKK